MKILKNKDASLTEFLLEQLVGIEDLRSRKMFGAHGVYAGSSFFALVHAGRVYFKTTPATRAPYEQAGMRPFYVGEKLVLKNYYQVPVEVLEDADEVNGWASAAIALAQPG